MLGFGPIIGIVILIVFVLFLIVNFIIWWIVSRQLYGKTIKPGEEYKVGERTYKLPELPLKGDARLLNETYLELQRELLQETTKVLNELEIEHWISGGTLLGFTRHKTFIPWDDDCDLHTHWKNREYMFSAEFGKELEKYNMEAIFLIGASTRTATKESAAVRIRKKKTITPICDIFFVKESSPGVFSKVDRWRNNKPVYNKKERWASDLLFPIRNKEVDDINLPFPNQPLPTLKQQYGKKVMEKMYARNVLFSHLYPFSQFQFVWTTH
jgi:hypothetical protein